MSLVNRNTSRLLQPKDDWYQTHLLQCKRYLLICVDENCYKGTESQQHKVLFGLTIILSWIPGSLVWIIIHFLCTSYYSCIVCPWLSSAAVNIMCRHTENIRSNWGWNENAFFVFAKISCILTKFHKNRLNLFIVTKNSTIFWKTANIFKLHRALPPVVHIFRETFRENKYFHGKTNIFSKKICHVKTFSPKMSLCFTICGQTSHFCELNESQHLLIFHEIAKWFLRKI
jgi:hypothetical protein